MLRTWRIRIRARASCSIHQNSYQINSKDFLSSAAAIAGLVMRALDCDDLGVSSSKIHRNNCHHESCGPSLTGKTSSVSLIFTHETHRNVKNR